VCRASGTTALVAARRAAVVIETGDRMFAGLPAVFRNQDKTGDLARLLGVLEAFFFVGRTEGGSEPHGLERYLEEIPALFSPIDTRREFLQWLAAWLSFTPHALFQPEPLRRIIGGIVPLYGLRGTRDYLVRLLELCFGDEVARIHVDDRPAVGFTIGQSTLAVDTRLAVSRPFCFKVIVEAQTESVTSHEAEALQHRLRAVIDFAKPAHTIYELEWRAHPRDTRRRDNSPISSGGGS
jgi:phage tail-like protein